MHCCNDEPRHKNVGVVWMKDDIKECPLCRMTVLLSEALVEISGLRIEIAEMQDAREYQDEYTNLT